MAKKRAKRATEATEGAKSGEDAARRAAVDVRHGEPIVRHAADLPDHGRCPATYEVDKRFWPNYEPLPKVYVKTRRPPVPCPECRRVLLDNGARAVACQSSGPEVAYFRCRACHHRWPLPVKME